MVKTAILVLIGVATLGAQVRYTVRFPNPQTHYAEVEAVFPAAGKTSVEVFMPVWTPGSYLVREYARNVEEMRAGNLPAVRTRKNRWRVATNGAAEIRFTYKVYCREMSVRSNWVEDSFALLNGAATFVAEVGGLQRRHEVLLELPTAWKTSMTGLEEAPGGRPHRYVAADYDTLVDSPIVAGNPAVYRFEVDGIPHFLVNQGEDGLWDGARAVSDVEKIVRRNRAMWGSLPYRKYVFLNLITEARGGLEHKNSVVMMASRWTTRTRKTYVEWLDLVSHEFFHAWNVKRLRPVELGPFDYETENHTASLWVAEGITDYYGALNVRRAGLVDQKEYLGPVSESNAGLLSTMINTLQTTPGRLVQSAEQASYDAWIKFYRPDENSANTAISYYTKGAVAGWLLDARIRVATRGAKSLDDAMRVAFDRFGGERGYTPEEFRRAAADVAGTNLDGFFKRVVESTEEVDYAEALEWFGLQFVDPDEKKSRKTWLGADTRVDAGRLVVSRVLRGTPGAAAGLMVDDEIVGMGDFRLRAEHLSARLENYKAGDKVSLLIARREKLVRVDLTLGEEPRKAWNLEPRPDASAAQKAHLDAWLKSE